ncbi:MAG: thermonuclease family protein [Candidatus Omnitrophica bacterium]|nr:thermonuclease family protein [Candidatus Omnitrophota bacterium]
MPKRLTFSSLTYIQLVKLIKSEIVDGKKIIQQTQAQKYWNIGKSISEYILNGKDRAKYGEHVFKKLADDLNVNARILYQASDFYRKFPILNARSQLSWTHFRELLTLPDSTQRKDLMEKARREGLTSREFKQLVQKKKVVIPTEGTIAQLKVTRGKLYTYKINEFKHWKSIELQKGIDCGFDVSYRPTAVQLAKFTAGKIIETLKADNNYSVKSSERVESDLFTFKAKVEKVIDGDTLLTRVNLGFRMSKKHKLRFRGIDTPEIDTPEGQLAHKFVEDRIKQCEFIVIKTHKDDKYGRYLVDVFYLPGEPDAQKVAATGIYLNQELLDNRLAVKW